MLLLLPASILERIDFGRNIMLESQSRLRVIPLPSWDTETGDLAVEPCRNTTDEAASRLAYCRSNRDRDGDGRGIPWIEDDCREHEEEEDASEDDRLAKFG